MKQPRFQAGRIPKRWVKVAPTSTIVPKSETDAQPTTIVQQEPPKPVEVPEAVPVPPKETVKVKDMKKIAERHSQEKNTKSVLQVAKTGTVYGLGVVFISFRWRPVFNFYLWNKILTWRTSYTKLAFLLAAIGAITYLVCRN